MVRPLPDTLSPWAFYVTFVISNILVTATKHQASRSKSKSILLMVYHFVNSTSKGMQMATWNVTHLGNFSIYTAVSLATQTTPSLKLVHPDREPHWQS